MAERGRGFFAEAGDFIFGDGEDPGLLGTGQYRVNSTEVNQRAGDLPGYRARESELADRQRQLDYRQPNTLDTERADEFRSSQMALAGDLLSASRGEGDSIAQQQLQRGMEANLASTVAAANTVRGPGGAASMGQLMANRANLGQRAAADASMLRLEEQNQARSQLAQLAATGRAADLETAQSNQQAEVELQRQKDDMVRYYMSLGLDMAKAQQAADLRVEEMRVQARLEEERLRAGAYENAAGRRGQVVRDTANAIGQGLGLVTGGG